MHVVYYEMHIRSTELVFIIAHRDLKGATGATVSTRSATPKCTSSGLLGDKVFSLGNPASHATHGNCLPPSSQIVQVRGYERIVESDQWSKAFVPLETQTAQRSIERKECKPSAR